ncbi:hypothetical protein [Antribacter gilvus]|uniref:hypothetical protein n=1 Tax=Antribacter gilvus TaxID=2304675 RepID=UPI000F7A2953|nr:hypothetical protein [Antribacter gilvus]
MSSTGEPSNVLLAELAELADSTRLIAYLCDVPVLDVRARGDQVDVGQHRVEALTVEVATADLAAAARMAEMLRLSPTPADGDGSAWAGWIPDACDEPFSVRVTAVEAGA